MTDKELIRFESHYIPEPNSGCWLWTASATSKGYGYFSIKGKNWRAHRVSFLIATGTLPKDNVLHRCDNPSCVNPDHLFSGTHLDNARDRDNKGRGIIRKWIENGHPRALLNSTQISIILTSKDASKDLAVRFGVADRTIRNIRRGNNLKSNRNAVAAAAKEGGA